MNFENPSAERSANKALVEEERISIIHDIPEATNDNEVRTELPLVNPEVPTLVIDEKEQRLIDEVTAIRKAGERIEEVYETTQVSETQPRMVSISEMHFSARDMEYIAREFSGYIKLTEESLKNWREQVLSQIQEIEEQSFLKRVSLSAKKNRLMHINQVLDETLQVIGKR